MGDAFRVRWAQRLKCAHRGNAVLYFEACRNVFRRRAISGKPSQPSLKLKSFRTTSTIGAMDRVLVEVSPGMNDSDMSSTGDVSEGYRSSVDSKIGPRRAKSPITPMEYLASVASVFASGPYFTCSVSQATER